MKNKKAILFLPLILIVLILSQGCTKQTSKIENTKFTCVLNPTKDSNVKGKLSVYKDGEKIMIQGEVTGLTPGKHGFHIHEKGDCSAPDGMSAGGHFNPTGKQHGDMGMESHAGDMGNIVADDKGTAKIDIKLDANFYKLEGENSIVGKSIIVHEKEDDLKTQPTGNSGARLACGVIEIVK